MCGGNKEIYIEETECMEVGKEVDVEGKCSLWRKVDICVCRRKRSMN